MARRVLAVGLCLALGACNMVLSETPMFGSGDVGALAPKEGIWVGEDEDCPFDAGQPESGWPPCATWVVARNSGRELELRDNKGQSQRLGATFVHGSPALIELQWIDEAKDPGKVIYVYFGLEPEPATARGPFSAAHLWPVECGTQQAGGSNISPFPGITAECRPTSKDSIRSAATSRRRPEQLHRWRWIRAERR
jgi:hypothetical protein